MPDKPPLIASQPILILDPSTANPREFLRPERFRAGRPQAQSDGREETHGPEVQHWQPTTFEQLFLDKGIRRLGLTGEAGNGKTTVLRRAQHEIMQADRRSLAIYARLRDLPETATDYLRVSGAQGHYRGEQPGCLVQILRQEFGRCQMEGAETDRAVQQLMRDGDSLLNRLAQGGRLVLLVDGLDEISRGDRDQAPARVRALLDFLLTTGRHCRVVIAGRPFALDRFWDDLFGTPDWRFARILDFRPSEQEQYLGTDRYQLLRRLDVEILAVPRSLEAIQTLEADELDNLRTASDVYWRCVDTMLAKAANPELIRQGFEDETFQWLLGALAFQMVLDGNFEGVSEGEFADFCERVWRRQAGKHSLRCGSPDTFKSLLRMLGQTNEFLDHAFLEGRGMKQVFWRNRALQEFFAGVWLAKFAPAEDSREMGRRLYLPHKERTRDYYWVWRFAAEMPAPGRAASCWIESMRPLYRPGTGRTEDTQRSSEMIYRSWGRLVQYATKEPHASDVRDEFLGEFELIRAAKWEHNAAEGRRRAEELVRNFIHVSAGSFRMGASPKKQSTRENETPTDAYLEPLVGHFLLARWPTINAWYRLFDPGHGCSKHEQYHRYSATDQTPVIYVSWYDAWAFCLWAHWHGHSCRLPAEHEWEYAAKAGTPWDQNYWWDDEFDASRCSGFARGATEVSDAHANPWGFCDILGNVGEWCYNGYRERYAATPPEYDSARVVRGGSWDVLPSHARSAYRDHASPGVSVNDIGFRIAKDLDDKRIPKPPL